MGKYRADVKEGYEEVKRRFVKEKGWYVPALHERYIEMRRGDRKGQARSK